MDATACQGSEAFEGVVCQANAPGDLIEVNYRAAPIRTASEMLEPYDEKLSRTVLRGESGRKPRDLPGKYNYFVRLHSILVS